MAKRQTKTKSALRDLPSGMDLLERPELNKGTAFTKDERKKFGLDGLLPPQIESLDEQLVRAYEAYKRKDDDLERHIYLRALQDTNEVLFYRLLLDHIEEMTPNRLHWPASSSATFTGDHAAYSSLTRFVIRSLRYCVIVQIEKSMWSS